MKTCIYCRKEKQMEEFSLEHVIPQFLGGSQAPDYLKTSDVCKECNNNLGLFVDAGFQKNLNVFNLLKETEYALFPPDHPSGLPLSCFAISELTPPELKDNEVCEYWIGPLGEQVFWIRPHDKEKHWYSGGNPRTVKKISSRAYFMFSERTLKAPQISWNAFKDAFSSRKVTKILCGQVNGADPMSIGFNTPTELDKKRIKYFEANCASGQEQISKVSIPLNSDIRFLAKLALGMAYVYFGKSAILGASAEELYKALWPKTDDTKPKIKYFSVLDPENFLFKETCGFDYGTTISLFPSYDAIMLNLNINKQLNWLIQCADFKQLKKDQIDALGEGKCFILVKPLSQFIELKLEELAAFNLGKYDIKSLSEINEKANLNKNFYKNL